MNLATSNPSSLPQRFFSNGSITRTSMPGILPHEYTATMVKKIGTAGPNAIIRPGHV